MKNRNEKVINNYASIVYLYYTKENKVNDIRDYPDYIASEIGLGFSIPFIKRLFKKGLMVDGEECFEVTEAGQRLLEDNWDYVRFFNLACPYISVSEYAKAKEGKQESFEETILSMIEEKAAYYRSKRNYVAVESLNIEMAQIHYYLENWEKALLHYLTTLCYSVSGVKEYIFIRNYKNGKITKKELVAKYNDCIYVFPEIIDRVKELAEYYYPNMINEIYSKAKLGFTLCSRPRFRELIDVMMKGEYTNSAWQASSIEIFKNMMGFTEAEAPKEISVEVEAIISQEDAQNEGLESEAKLAEIAEEKAKKE